MTEPDDHEPSPGQPHEEPPAPPAPPGRPPYGGPPPQGHPYGGPPPGPPQGGVPPYGGPPPAYGPGPYPPPYGPPRGTDEPTWALAAYVGQLVIGFIAPLIVFLVKKDESPFMRFHGAQALNVALSYIGFFIGGIALVILGAAAKLPALLIIAIPAMIVFVIAHFVFLIIAAVRAGRREMYRLPSWICWRMVK